MTRESDLPGWAQEALNRADDMMSRGRCLRAKLVLHDSADGGRRQPIVAGWTTGWEIGNSADGHRPDNNAIVLPDDLRELVPGSTALVRLVPIHPQRWSKVGVGDELRMRDAHRVIGTATVVELIPPTNKHLDGRWPLIGLVRLRRELAGLPRGSKGTIVDVYSDAYEVEFVEPDGSTRWIGAVSDHDLELVWTPS